VVGYPYRGEPDFSRLPDDLLRKHPSIGGAGMNVQISKFLGHVPTISLLRASLKHYIISSDELMDGRNTINFLEGDYALCM